MNGFVLAAAKTLIFHVACLGNAGRYFGAKGSLMRAAARYGLYERQYLEVLPFFVSAGSTVVDAGANFGAYTHALARLAGTTGRVIAFEPLPPIAERLARACAGLSNVTVIPEALSDRHDDDLRLRVPFIGWNVPEPALARSDDEDISRHAWRTFRVRARRLDDHADLVKGVRFIKADLEGHEMPFLAGAEATIAASRPVLQVESSGVSRHQETAAAWLRTHDYVLFTFSSSRFRPAAPSEALSLNVYLVPSETVSGLPPRFEAAA